MGKTAIQWATDTWNPTTGCDRVSPGCANCYAMSSAPRLQAMAKGLGRGPEAPYMRDGDPKTSGPGFGLMLHPSRLEVPLRWKKPRRIFVNSMSDLFHEGVPDEFIDQVMAVAALAPQHQFLILTKRPERMRTYMERREDAYGRHPALVRVVDLPPKYKVAPQEMGVTEWPLPNVWLGTSVENARWRTRIDELRQTPAAIRFLSCEPLLGPLASRAEVYLVDDEKDSIDRVPDALNLGGIDWVIIGGESGAKARPMNEDWVRDIIAACRAQGVKPFVKQMGSVWAREHLGRESHAGYPEEWPEDLRVREEPA